MIDHTLEDSINKEYAETQQKIEVSLYSETEAYPEISQETEITGSTKLPSIEEDFMDDSDDEFEIRTQMSEEIVKKKRNFSIKHINLI